MGSERGTERVRGEGQQKRHTRRAGDRVSVCREGEYCMWRGIIIALLCISCPSVYCGYLQ